MWPICSSSRVGSSRSVSSAISGSSARTTSLAAAGSCADSRLGMVKNRLDPRFSSSPDLILGHQGDLDWHLMSGLRDLDLKSASHLGQLMLGNHWLGVWNEVKNIFIIGQLTIHIIQNYFVTSCCLACGLVLAANHYSFFNSFLTRLANVSHKTHKSKIIITAFCSIHKWFRLWRLVTAKNTFMKHIKWRYDIKRKLWEHFSIRLCICSRPCEFTFCSICGLKMLKLNPSLQLEEQIKCRLQYRCTNLTYPMCPPLPLLSNFFNFFCPAQCALVKN